MDFRYNDGGRIAAGYKGKTGDCVARAIAIATGLMYQDIYTKLALGNQNQRITKRTKKSIAGKKTAAKGIYTKRKWFRNLMNELGFEWIACMKIGSGCKVHLNSEELPKGKLIVAVSKHYTCVIDGVLQDTYDCSRNGKRCVYGYWKLNN
jgi:hypothetical protein